MKNVIIHHKKENLLIMIKSISSQNKQQLVVRVEIRGLAKSRVRASMTCAPTG